MAVTEQSSRNVSTAAPGATVFPYNFKIFDKHELLVMVDDVIKTVDVDFTVTGAGQDGGGTITFLAPMTGGETVMRRRNMKFERQTDYQNLGDLRSPTLNNDQDAPVMMIQQLDDAVGRALRLGDASPDGGGHYDANGNRIRDLAYAESASEAAPYGQVKDEILTAITNPNTALFLQGGVGATQRTIADKLRDQVSVRDFGAVGDGVTDDRAAIQAAIDYGAAKGIAVSIPAGLWIIGTVEKFDRGAMIHSGLQYHENSHIVGAGIDTTTLRLADDAHEDANLLEPSTKDVPVSNWSVSEMTLDGNAARPTVSGLGNHRPGSSCMATLGSNKGLIRNMRFTQGVLHCLDICNAGEVDAGRRWYALPANRSETYYPGPLSNNIVLEGAIYADGGGDDNITGHYSHDIHVNGDIVSREPGARHPGGVHVSNPVELDDGCFRWFINKIHSIKGSRGFVVKCHSPEPAPFDIIVNQVVAERCHSGAMIRDPGYPGGGAPLRRCARNVSIGILHIIDPEVWAGDSGDDPTDTDRNALDVRSYGDVVVGQIIADASDDEEGLNSAIIVRSSSKAVTIGSATLKNWPFDSSSDANNSAIFITGSCSDINIGPVDISNCGWRGIVSNGADRVRLAGGTIRGTGLAGSVAVRMSAHPSANGSSVGPFTVTGFDTHASYGSQSAARPIGYTNGDITASGLLKIGLPSLTVDRNQITLANASAAGAEVIRFEGASFIGAFYNRGPGGSGGMNGANTCFGIATMESTGRSINAGGTINASGADYAEYMLLQPHLWGVVAKGALLGLDVDGLLTDRWSEVVGPVLVKSTAPNLVGGDNWGSEEALCAKYGVEPVGDEPDADPEAPEESAQARAAWLERKAQMADALETERRRWDRMALCGQVPVNVPATPADVGKFLVAVEGEGGGITGEWRARGGIGDAEVVGRLVRIEDGRAVVLVR